MLPLPALAALGDNAASVLTDQARMKGTLRSMDAHAYVIHEITAPTGTVAREFVSPQELYLALHGKARSRPTFSSCWDPITRKRNKQLRSRKSAWRAGEPGLRPISSIRKLQKCRIDSNSDGENHKEAGEQSCGRHRQSKGIGAGIAKGLAEEGVARRHVNPRDC